MPRDSSGNYTLPLGNPVIDGTIIDVNWANPTMNDIALQLNNVITRDGLLGPTLPMYFPDGTFALPGVSFASQNGTGMWKDPTQLGLSFNGAAVQTWNGAGSTIQGALNVTGALSVGGVPIGTAYVAKTGDTMTGALNFSMNGDFIVANTVTPGAPQEMNITMHQNGIALWKMGMEAGSTSFRFKDFTSWTPLSLHPSGVAMNGGVTINHATAATLSLLLGGVTLASLGLNSTETALAASGQLSFYTGGASRKRLEAGSYTEFFGNISNNTGGTLNNITTVLRTRNQVAGESLHSAFLADMYRDIADPCYGAGIWFTRTEILANASSYGSIIFGAQSNGAGSYPAERLRINGNTGVVSVNPDGTSYEVGFRDLPRIDFSANMTVLSTHRGKMITMLAPATFAQFDGTQGYPVGAIFSILNATGAPLALNAISGMAFQLTGTALSGNRTIASQGMATIWLSSSAFGWVSGPGVS